MEPKPTLAVSYSAIALKELDRIWEYNAKAYGSADHATQYIDFLKGEIQALSSGYADGRKIENNPTLRYLLMRRKASGHGHVAVYRVTKAQVQIAHVFHTAQDWGRKVKAKRA